jgi:predicted transposase/invertase (TIGR01784 family)
MSIILVCLQLLCDTPMSFTPRVDIAFKKIFGVEENKDLLISLINSILSDADQISDLTLLNPYNPQNFKNDKLSIFDIKAEGKCGKKFNIELQMTDQGDYDKRALYYWAKLYAQQLGEGEDYGNLSKAIGIHILNFNCISNTEKYHNIFHITEKESGESYFTDLELHTIELKKFKGHASKELSDLVQKIKTVLDIWVAFLTRHNLLTNVKLPKKLDNAALKKALTVLEIMNFSEQEREAYEDHLKWLRDEASAVKKAEDRGEGRGIEIGKAEGIEIGKIKGIEIGTVKGIEIGKVEGIEIGKVEGIEIGKVKGIEIGKVKGIEIGKVKGIEIGKVKGIEIGKVEGIEIGKVEGIELGKAEGIELGKKQNIEQIVISMLQKNIDIELICGITGLSTSEINILSKSILLDA